jgi:AcrR family transcriptional regulator
MGRNPERNRLQLEQTRARLMEAGRQVILEQGLQRVQVKDIIRQAKVGVGTFYFHFKDLEEFQNEVIRTAIDEIRPQVREIRGLRDGSAPQDQETRSRRAFEIFFDFIDQNDEIALIWLRERTGTGPVADLIRGRFEAFTADLKEDLEEAARYGLIPTDIPCGLAAEAILGMSLQLAESYAARRVAEARSSTARQDELSRKAAQDREQVISILTRISYRGLTALPTDQLDAKEDKRA